MSEVVEAGLEALLLFLQQQRGFDFTGYKRPSLMRRIRRRMQLARAPDYDAYMEYLEAHPEEFPQLFNTILINVTSFFRDAPAWDYMKREVLPQLLERKGAHAPLRVWSAGCASGEEAYSVAIMLAEALGDFAEFRERVKVYATDVDEEALAQARLASYPAKSLQDVDPALRERYFDFIDGRHLFRGDLRRSLIFGRHDLLQDAPISRLDLLVCRNTLMYFNAPTQARIMSRFHFALNGEREGGGILFLGRAEMLLTHAGLFRPLDLKCRIFAKLPQPGARPRAAPPSRVPAGNGRHDPQ
jgi:two-component system, chemotaxis family, CheB/CheR fusion protein